MANYKPPVNGLDKRPHDRGNGRNPLPKEIKEIRELAKKDFTGKYSSIFCPGFSYPHCSYRNTSRHLDNGEQGIDTFEITCGQGNTNYRYNCPASKDAGQVRCHTCPGDNNLNTTLLCTLTVFPGLLRGAMG